jgi:hypothetical protein
METGGGGRKYTHHDGVTAKKGSHTQGPPHRACRNSTNLPARDVVHHHHAFLGWQVRHRVRTQCGLLTQKLHREAHGL